MPSRRRVVLSAAVLGSALTGCPTLLSDDFRVAGEDAGIDASDSANAPEASAGAGDDGGPPADASDGGAVSDRQAGACCSVLADPLDQATFDHWVPIGAASPFPAFVELTPDRANQAGAVFWPTTASLSDFEVAFDFSITKPADSGVPADGFAFVAMAAIDGTCEAGGNLCLVGTSPGFGLVVRTYRSPKEPAVPYIAFVDTSRHLEDDAGPSILGDAAAHFEGGIVTVGSTSQDPTAAAWQSLCVTAKSGRATVKLNGKVILSNVPLPASSSARWGFVAATGGSTERNAVRQVRLSSSVACDDATACQDGGLCGN